jgi:hypothetical protein
MEAPSPQTMTSKQIVRELASDASLLLDRHARLARAELAEELRREKRAGGLMGASGLCAWSGFTLAWVAVALALGAFLGAEWAGALIVAGALLIISGVLGGVGWAGRVKHPFARSRSEASKEIAWARRQMSH